MHRPLTPPPSLPPTVDVWDGQDEPVVYHGNTLTSKVPFRDVVDAIASYSFDFSVWVSLGRSLLFCFNCLGGGSCGVAVMIKANPTLSSLLHYVVHLFTHTLSCGIDMNEEE